MLICFFDVKKGLSPTVRHFFATKTVVIPFTRDFIAMRTVVIYNDNGPHGDEVPCHCKKPRTSRQQAPKIPLEYLERPPIYLKISDSPEDKIYHFARVFLFR